MIEKTINISSIECAKDFVAVVNNYKSKITLSSDRYKVNGKSLLGVFTLDYNNPIKACIDGEDEKELSVQLDKFIN